MPKKKLKSNEVVINGIILEIKPPVKTPKINIPDRLWPKYSKKACKNFIDRIS